jgi:hypothetical protein
VTVRVAVGGGGVGVGVAEADEVVGLDPLDPVADGVTVLPDVAITVPRVAVIVVVAVAVLAVGVGVAVAGLQALAASVACGSAVELR